MGDHSLEAGSASERELSELRERETRYRDRLSSTAARMRNLREHTAELLEILRRAPPRARDMRRTLAEVARVSRSALGVKRASVWMFDPRGERLERVLSLCEDDSQPPPAAIELSDCPAYARALTTSGVLAVENTLEDPRMKGLEAYLSSSGVAALLDIAIAIPGERLGVVCHEHLGGPRSWQPEEIDFATHVANLIALALEVERRQAAEAKTVSAEARYRYLVESLPVTVYSFDAFSNRLEYLSPQFSELGLFGHEEAFARGVSAWLDRIHPDDRPLIESRFAPHGVESVPPEVTYRLRLPSGGLRYVRDQCRVVRNHAGDPVAIQGVLADVTAARLSEQRAAEFERRLRSLLEHVELIGMILDSEGRFEFVNACFERTTGHPASELLGVDAFELLVEAPEVEANRARYQRDLGQNSLPARFENEIVTRSGERRRVVWTTTILRTEDGAAHGTCSLGLDVTDRVRLEAELLQQSKLESLGQLSAGVAHDFNNLLTVMTCEAESLSHQHTDPDSQQSLHLMQQAIGQASELTRSLLVYARKDSVTLRAVAVDRLIADNLQLLNALSGKALPITASLHGEGARVLIDPSQLRQVIINLVGNAVDATRDHGTRITISSAVEFSDDDFARKHGARQAGSFVVITVSDDGRGMDRRTLSRVFEPFFTTKEPGKGTGLGLAMCDSILRRVNGFIRVESEPGAGTHCRVYLPVVPAEDLGNDSTPPTASDLPGRPKVLIVEDESLIRRQIARSLESLKLQVHCVGSVSEAQRTLASEAIDLLITDGSLPDGLGRILAESARAARPALRVLLISGGTESQDPYDAILPKPFTSQRLVETVKRLMLL